jgi:uncharacterized DUF497 family protein
MNFEHDKNKFICNRLKHGITLEEAQLLWKVPAIEIQAKTVDEPRSMRIGRMQGKSYSCFVIM